MKRSTSEQHLQEASIEVSTQIHSYQKHSQSLSDQISSLSIIHPSPYVLSLHQTLIAAPDTVTFKHAVKQLSRQVLDYALDNVHQSMFTQHTQDSANQHAFTAVEFVSDGLCAVNVLQGGTVLQECLMEQEELQWSWGHVLVQEDKVIYAKFPPMDEKRLVLVLEAVVCRKSGILQVLDTLFKRGSFEGVMLVSLISTMQVVKDVADKFPQVKFITSRVIQDESELEFNLIEKINNAMFL